ncbi:MAG: DnaJ C-terminal domain-containing protein [Clostridia bacterium]
MQYKDYYKILGVDRKADKATIKKAFRSLAKKHHPDTTQGKQSDEKFKEINEAYEALSDPEKRRKYDQFGSGQHFKNGHEFDPSSFGFQRNTGGSQSDFSDFFNMFFSDGFEGGDIFRGARTRHARKARDYEGEIEITLREAMEGTEKSMMAGERTITIKIPPGIKDKGKIKYRGKGEELSGSQSGDLYLTARIRPEKGWELDGSHIIRTVQVHPWEAYFGEQITVEHFGENIKFRLPRDMDGMGSVRIPGKGYWKADKTRGDLFIKVQMVNPRKMTTEQEELYRKLKDISGFEGKRGR